MNSIWVIHPYIDGGALVFDDPAVGLHREPFVMGADSVLQLAARAIGADPSRFTLIFSDIPFPGHQAQAEWFERSFHGEAETGNWYTVILPGLGQHDAWLCPALLKYFPQAPLHLFFSIQPFERVPA